MLYRPALVLALAGFQTVSAAGKATWIVTGGSCPDSNLKASFLGALMAVPGAAGKFSMSGLGITKDGDKRTVVLTLTKEDDALSKTIGEYFTGSKNGALVTVISNACSGVTAVESCVSTDGKCSSGGSGGGGGGAAAPCFPSSAMVTMADGAQKRIASLVEGDSILAANLKGDLTTDTVSLFSIADSAVQNRGFFSITTESKATLNVTAEHHIATGGSCCSELKKADDLVIGDTVWVLSTGKPMPVAEKVKKVSIVVDDGLHSPVLTNGGMPIVNGFVTSFDKYSSVRVASTALPFLVSLCKKTASCPLMQRLFSSSEQKHIA